MAPAFRQRSPEHDAWLAQVEEPILEPELAICDPHHHLWEFGDDRYLLADLLKDVDSGHRIVSTVFVECAAGYRDAGPEPLRCVGETEFVQKIVEQNLAAGGAIDVCAGIVGLADCMLGAGVGQVLDAHLAASERFRGIRHAAARDPSPEVPDSHTRPIENLYRDATFRKGFAELAPRGLSFEAWQYHHQLPLVTELARAFPDTTIVVNHLSGPVFIGPYAGKQDEIFEVWQRDIAECARCQNVVIKLGGILMRRNGFGFEDRERPATSDEVVVTTGRWYRHAIECFGPERCMFESNFPVDRVSVSYAVLWNAFKKLVADASAAEKAALFHDTAARVYRIRAGRSEAARRPSWPEQ
ncbi:MAG: amidohydrolase family protein [Pseudomonadales bacterium]|nr:amidohydrolase family protein [Pseudomonadales bacterium]